MAEYELAIRARRAVTPAGVRPVTVAVRDGRIAAVAGFSDAPDAAELAELYGREILLPGLVDSHVHVNEPGRTEWEGFASATRAAAEGGVTTLIDMPLNCLPPTTSMGALRLKQAALTHALPFRRVQRPILAKIFVDTFNKTTKQGQTNAA